MKRILIVAGLTLFVLGGLSGALPHRMENRLAIISHLTAIVDGVALIAFASIWQYVALPRWGKNFAGYVSILGAYLVFGALTYGAVLGLDSSFADALAHRMLNISGGIVVSGNSAVLLGAIRGFVVESQEVPPATELDTAVARTS